MKGQYKKQCLLLRFVPSLELSETNRSDCESNHQGLKAEKGGAMAQYSPAFGTKLPRSPLRYQLDFTPRIYEANQSFCCRRLEEA